MAAEKTDHTLWQTYQITGVSKTKIPILQDTTHNSLLGPGKIQRTRNFEQIHTNAFNTYSPIEQYIEHKAILIRTTLPIQENFLFCTPEKIKYIIKKFLNINVPRLYKITTIKQKNLPTKPLIQLYYIFKACLNL